MIWINNEGLLCLLRIQIPTTCPGRLHLSISRREAVLFQQAFSHGRESSLEREIPSHEWSTKRSIIHSHSFPRWLFNGISQSIDRSLNLYAQFKRIIHIQRRHFRIAATQRALSQDLSQLTVKMAPTIEYPAQQCDASPKSLHIVLFYNTVCLSKISWVPETDSVIHSGSCRLSMWLFRVFAER